MPTGGTACAAKAAVIKHGQDLLAIFPNAAERDPVKLCRKLRKLEREGAALGLRLCNGPEYAEGEADRIQDGILGRVNALLGNEGGAVPVFVNLDPRGYALKIDSTWLQAARRDGKTVGHSGCCLHQDWGGYGIVAPDLSEK